MQMAARRWGIRSHRRLDVDGMAMCGIIWVVLVCR